jgi:Winged helix-turn helix
MAAWRRAIELSLGDADTEKLRSIAQSRTEPASRVERARILLAYREDPSFFAVGRALGLHHQTVQRCVERAVAEGPLAVLDDRPRPGRAPTITLEAKTWLVSFRAYLKGDQSLARRPAGASLRIYFHAQTRLLAQSRGGLLFETHPFRPATHSRRLQARAQGSPHRRRGLFQPRSRRSHLDLQAR